jgi:hypothetical protein
MSTRAAHGEQAVDTEPGWLAVAVFDRPEARFALHARDRGVVKGFHDETFEAEIEVSARDTAVEGGLDRQSSIRLPEVLEGTQDTVDRLVVAVIQKATGVCVVGGIGVDHAPLEPAVADVE